MKTARKTENQTASKTTSKQTKSKQARKTESKTTSTSKTTSKASKGKTESKEQGKEQAKAAYSLDDLKRAFEQAYTCRNCTKDAGEELQALAQAVAYSVLHKLIDPDAKRAKEQGRASNTGYSPVMVSLRQGMARDIHNVDNLRKSNNAATALKFNSKGDLKEVTIDKDAARGVKQLLDATISDGMDIVQTAALALWEQATQHGEDGPAWLDKPHTVKELSRHVRTRLEDSAAYREYTTTPIQTVYRKVRKEVENSRAVRAVLNGFTYVSIDEYKEDAEVQDRVYYRMGRYMDLGGTQHGTASDIAGAPAGFGGSDLYTADIAAVDAYNTMLQALELTPRQAEVYRLRLQGKGYKDIATYLGVTREAVRNTLHKMQEKAVKRGLCDKNGKRL